MNRSAVCPAFALLFGAAVMFGPPLANDASVVQWQATGCPLTGEICYTLQEAKVLTDRWRQHDNAVRPHSALRYRRPAPAAH